MPLHVFHSLAELAGFTPTILTYNWKVQSDPELARDYAEQQKKGFGPFFFYRAAVLQEAFAHFAPAESGRNALEVERALVPQRLDPATAYQAFRNGERIGHTVVVLKSEPR